MLRLVKKMTWERGEEYGDIYYPENICDLKNKIQELDSWGRKNDYSFFIEFQFDDGSIFGFTVAHEYSFVEFSFNKQDGSDSGPCYLVNGDGSENDIIPVYYFGHWTEPDTTKMLPFIKVLNAFYHYVECYKFTADIAFDDNEANKNFILTHLQN